MKLPYQQLSKHLTHSLAPLYLVSSDELLLAQEAVDQIRDAARKSGFTERVRVIADSPNDWAEAIYSHSHHLSLFATKRLIELNFTQTKVNSAIGKLLEEYALHPPADTILIAHTNKLDSKMEKNNWYQSIEKKGVIIQIWPIALEQLPQWIMHRATKANFTLAPQAASWLAAQVEGNLLAAAQEIEKLALLQPGHHFDQLAIEAAVSDQAHFDIFTLVDAALSGNSKRSLRILQSLKAEDTEPVLILWALTRELRTLADISQQIAKGATLTSVFPTFRIWEKRQPAVRAFLQRHKQSDCWSLLMEAANIDRIIKGADKGNVWTALQNFLLHIATPLIKHS